jgi:hypothetical protein
LVFEYRNRYFKLLNFIHSKDGSFYFTIYRHDNELTERIQTEETPTGGILLSVEEVVQGQFPAAKISRHRSGCVHVQSKKREIERKGIQSVPFDDIAFQVILVVCPQEIDRLVEIDKPRQSDLVVHLPDCIEPFVVQFAVHDRRIQVKVPVAQDELLGGKAISVSAEGQSHGLVIMLVNVRKPSPETALNFPARTCYLVF